MDRNSRSSTPDEDEDEGAPPIPAGSKNYITPGGYQRLKDEALRLLDRERPDLVKVIAWAASNGDRSENADYIYGKRRLREIDRRIRFLTKRLEAAEVIDPTAREATDQVFFGEL
jgi:transcription elongation factor GreB